MEELDVAPLLAHRGMPGRRTLSTGRDAIAWEAIGVNHRSHLKMDVLPFCSAMLCIATVLRHRARVVMRGKGKPMATAGIRVRKPKNNALRNTSIPTYEELTTRARYRPLTAMFRRRFARPKGKPIMMATRTCRQSGHKYLSPKRHAKLYRTIDFNRAKRGMYCEIETVEYDPYRHARICLVKYEDGEKRYILYAMGMFVGQQVIADLKAAPIVGNAMPLDNVPIGTQVHNVEMHPQFGGAVCRAAGTSCTVLARDDKYVTVKMPSSEVRLLHKNCWCTVGRVGRPEANLVKIGKAGRRRGHGWKPHVRGKAKNACDHPHGGGEGRSPIGHKHPRTPFGKAALGLKTKNKSRPSRRLILIEHKKKSGRP